MVDITLFELHLDGAEFTANAPFSSSDEDETESTSRWRRRSKSGSSDDASESESDTESGGAKKGLLALFAVGALAVVAVALVRFLGGSGEDDGLDES